jgi:7-cyano-7-deazaguanine synthase in queuosine biosynthesis
MITAATDAAVAIPAALPNRNVVTISTAATIATARKKKPAIASRLP